ncbi:MAG: hypothetical protein CMH25_02975 [Micavibrio sp.]|nr:hypothetical protein [Micavibrio sp.]|tara:strand:+ start:581574 stop:582380 length:807 start_codon:yes stop_codon:yes gene_type:complete
MMVLLLKQPKFYITVTALAVAVLSYPLTSSAEILAPKTKGMNHVVISTDGPESLSPAPEDTTEKASPPAQTDLKEEKEQPKLFSTLNNNDLEMQDALVPTDKLEEWPYSGRLFAFSLEKRVEALKAMDTSLGTLSPYMMFKAAETAFDAGEREKGAVLYYMAQLRAGFDTLRWPYGGQKNPQTDVKELSSIAGANIAPWVLKSGARATQIFETVQKLDAVTPYGYQPYYRIPSTARPESEWPALLSRARTSYFSKVYELEEALSKLKN